MTLMDALRAEIEAWSEEMVTPSSREVLDHFYAETLDGGTPDDLAELSIPSVLSMLGPMPPAQMTLHMATWCSAVLLGVRAARRAAS